MQPHLPEPEEYVTGVHTIFLHKMRMNPNAKVWNQQMRNANIAELNKAHAYEGILITDDGFITEGSRSNVFFVQENTVFTTPENHILQGITRKKVLEICRWNQIHVKQLQIRKSDISKFSSMFLTGTSRKVLPVKSIENIQFSVENTTMQTIVEEFEEYVLKYIKATRKLDRSLPD
jgi:branched-chain amino acid aminotransferase